MTPSAEISAVDLAVKRLVRCGRSNVRRRTKAEYSCATSKAKDYRKVHDWSAYLLHIFEHINDERQGSLKSMGENGPNRSRGNH